MAKQMKSISDLEAKGWYRLIKVVYVLGFILSLALAVGLSFAAKPYQLEVENIHCSDGKKIPVENITGLNRNSGIYIEQKNESPFFSSENIYVFKDKTLNKHALGLCNNNAYGIYQGTVTEGNWFNVIKYVIIGIGLVWGLFEIIKRAFYYIVLGKALPDKIN